MPEVRVQLGGLRETLSRQRGHTPISLLASGPRIPHIGGRGNGILGGRMANRTRMIDTASASVPFAGGAGIV